MAMHVISALAKELNKELDAHTSCVLIPGNKEEEANYVRQKLLIKKILEKADLHFTRPQFEKIIIALRYSAKNHAGIYRKDKFTPYLLHPLEVAYIILELGVYDFKTIVSAILHDVPEDIKTMSPRECLKDIGKVFGAAVRNIVNLLTKHSNEEWLYWQHIKREVDLNCRWRVILIKFADRIHNMSTLKKVPDKSKRTEKVDETFREFPELYNVFVKTIRHLWNRGTIKNKKYLYLPFRANNLLYYATIPHIPP